MKLKCIDCMEVLELTHFRNSDYYECPECELAIRVVGDNE